MGMRPLRNIALVLLAFLLGPSVASASIYSISSGTTNQVVSPIVSSPYPYGQSAAEFYNYNYPNTYSGDPAFGTRSDAAYFWLYADEQNSLSLGMIFDTPQDATGGTMQLSISGLPSNAYWVVRDDPGEWSYTISSEGETNPMWQWSACCTDGGVIAGLGNTVNPLEWDIVIDLVASQSISNWFFLSGPDRNNPTLTEIDLSRDGSLIISSSVSVVPLPPSAILFGTALLGLAGLRRKKRKAA